MKDIVERLLGEVATCKENGWGHTAAFLEEAAAITLLRERDAGWRRTMENAINALPDGYSKNMRTIVINKSSVLKLIRDEQATRASGPIAPSDDLTGVL